MQIMAGAAQSLIAVCNPLEENLRFCAGNRFFRLRNGFVQHQHSSEFGSQFTSIHYKVENHVRAGILR
jgi:hypothetical protein